ncbi:MAG: hypothetical protein Q8N39_10485 [Pelolinea sp.]|nr:hypothetical protein [Pelolinea sp.]
MKSSFLRLVIVLIAILAVSVACSLPFVISPVQPEEKIVYVEITSIPAAPPAPTSAPAPTAESPAPAVTPTVSVNLDGSWAIWQGTSEQQLDIDFLQIGYSLVGNTATGNGHSLLFNGTISQDGKSVSGTWESTSGTSGSFIMALDASYSAFSGNLGGGVPFCGSRSGTKPSPCIK